MRPRDYLRPLPGLLFRWAGVVVLNYHRIGDGRGSVFDRGLWSAEAERFDEQLGWLKSHFDVISPRDIPYVVRVKRGRHVVVTFDDGYLDNYTVAYPLLQARGLRATFFVTTHFIDEQRVAWWDEIAWMVRASKRSAVELPAYLPAPVAYDEPGRERAVRTLLVTYKRLPAIATAQFLADIGEATGSGRYPASSDDHFWMTWDMLREMRAGGMTIGGHTMSHQILSRMPREEQLREILGCGERLSAELGVPMRTFSYPVGHRDCFDDATRDCLVRAGVRSAFSYCGGFRALDAWDDYDVPRIAVEQDTSFGEFRVRLMAPWSTRT